MNMLHAALASALLVAPSAQEPPAAPAVVAQDGDTWTPGFARAPSFRSAVAQALEDAVGKAKGVQIARGPSIRSRIAVVTEHQDGAQAGWFDGEGEDEHEWVQQQIAGFVQKYEVVEQRKADDGMWEVAVRALVAGLDRFETTIVVELVDSDLTQWALERYEEDGPGRPFDRRTGSFEGPRIGEYLRKSGAVKIASSGDGVTLRPGSAAGQREKAGHELVPSHRVVVRWEPLVVQSLVEKSNKARPSAGPRPEFLSGGAVQVALRIEDLVERTVVLEQSFSVLGDGAATYSADRRDAFLTKLVDKAKATVATKIFFALRPPVVLRKWVGDDGDWLVEARIARGVAQAFQAWMVGNDGSLASPDWVQLAEASLVGGSSTSCTFALGRLADPALVEPDRSQVRPKL